jgi:hypothetical protein
MLQRVPRVVALMVVVVEVGCGETNHPATDSSSADAGRDGVALDSRVVPDLGDDVVDDAGAGLGHDAADMGGSMADAVDIGIGQRDTVDVGSGPSDVADLGVGLVDASDARTTGADATDSGAGLTDATDIATSLVDATAVTREIGGGEWGEAGACAGEMLSAAESAAYFPFAVGAQWVFRAKFSGNTAVTAPRLSRREVTGTRLFGDAAVAVVSETTNSGLASSTADVYLEVATDGLIDHGGSTTPSTYGRPALYAVPFTAIPFPIQTCAPFVPFEVSGVQTARDEDGDGQPESIAVSATAMLSLEDVTVAVGTFPKALRLETFETMVETFSTASYGSRTSQQHTIDWYAAGVGLIKRYVATASLETTSELIAYAVGDIRRGVVPVGYVARNLDEASSNPYTPNRPAIGFDGHQFLVVVPTSKDTGRGQAGNLVAVVIDRDGHPLSSAPLLDSSNALRSVAMAWDGQRYLVAYQNTNYGRIEMIVVSSTGETQGGPFVLKDGAGAPSVVATQNGFLVAYTVSTQAPGSTTYVSNLWLAPVDVFGHASAPVQPFLTSQQWSASLAKDGAGGIMALFNTPPATPSPTLPEEADILAVARIGSDGTAIDLVPIAVDAVPGVGHDETKLVFDGTSFVASWTQRRDSSTIEQHVARVTPMGEVLDGAPTTGSGFLVGTGNTPRIARFGSGSLLVWGHRSPEDYYSQGVGAARFTATGTLLDQPAAGDDRWLVSDYGAGWYSLPEILWGDDRALVVWRTPNSQSDLFDIGCAVAYPW